MKYVEFCKFCLPHPGKLKTKVDLKVLCIFSYVTFLVLVRIGANTLYVVDKVKLVSTWIMRNSSIGDTLYYPLSLPCLLLSSALCAVTALSRPAPCSSPRCFALDPWVLVVVAVHHTTTSPTRTPNTHVGSCITKSRLMTNVQDHTWLIIYRMIPLQLQGESLYSLIQEVQMRKMRINCSQSNKNSCDCTN